MTQSVPLWAILAVVIAGGVLFLASQWVKSMVASAQRIIDSGARVEAAHARAEAALDRVTESLKPAAEELRVNMAAVPKLLETVARIGSAQIEMMKARAEEKPNPFGRPNGPLPPRDPASLNLEYDVSTIMRQKGVSREEALSQLNQANSQSVWEGNTMFQGWGD